MPIASSSPAILCEKPAVPRSRLDQTDRLKPPPKTTRKPAPRWTASRRNGGRLQIGSGGRLRRNPQLSWAGSDYDRSGWWKAVTRSSRLNDAGVPQTDNALVFGTAG